MSSSIDKTARCKYCGVSQRERLKECKGGIKFHKFIRTQILTYDSQLKQLWEESQ